MAVLVMKDKDQAPVVQKVDTASTFRISGTMGLQ